jgi:hypothetical protein
MPVIVSKAAAPRPRREGVRVPGIYESWIRDAAETHATGAVEDTYGDIRARFDPETGRMASEAEVDSALSAAHVEAARRADERIASGEPLIGKLLVCEESVWGIAFFRDRADTVYDIHRDDSVYVNAEATRLLRERHAAEEARLAALLAQPVIEPEEVSNALDTCEHNGAAVSVPETNGHNRFEVLP